MELAGGRHGEKPLVRAGSSRTSMSSSSATAAARRGMRALAVLGRCARAPLRALVRARDLYVSRMAACAGGGGGGGPVRLVAMPRCQSHGFYRSGAGGAAAEDDVRELIRAAARGGAPRPPGVAPRSQSVAVGRIDEDRPCEFGPEALGPRSMSCAVASSSSSSLSVAARRVGVAAA
ncbi:hypothetical protein ACP4OV_026562 [Aristida adscensionis]